VEKLASKGCLSNPCSVISIGSTATVENNNILSSCSNPSYAIAKEMQRLVSFNLQRQLLTSGVRITTLTVGGIGDTRIQVDDIFSVIQCFHHLSPSCKPMELIMASHEDFEEYEK
jgi:hypothetical protein